MTPRLSDVLVALVFFTRLPLPSFMSDRKLGEVIWAAPLVGLVVALLGAIVFALVDALDVPTLPAAAITLAAMMLLTGCLHEDGLADVADGFGGGKTIERKLEIMHDSRLGTYGAVALMTSVLIRWSALATLASHGAVLAGLIAAHVASRAIFARLIRDTQLATHSGLAATVGPVPAIGAAASLAIGIAGLLFLGVFGALVTALAVGVVTLAFRQLCLRQIGGITGDTLGASQQFAEMTILVAAAAVFS